MSRYIKNIHINKVRHLSNINIPLEKEDYPHLMITGKNGSGKTSLLNAIANHIERIANDSYKNFEVYKRQIEYLENELENNPQNTLSTEQQLQFYKNQYELFFGEVIVAFEDIDSLIRKYQDGNFIIAFYEAHRTTWIDGERKKLNRYSESVLAYSGSDIIVNETVTYRDGNGVVVTEKGTQTNTTTYTVAGGNLIKKIERGQTTEYKYDSNINPRPLNALMKAAAPDYFLKENYSKNNLIEQVDSYTDLQGNLVKNIASIELTYNSKGYPTMKKFFRQRGSNVKTLQYIEEIEY